VPAVRALAARVAKAHPDLDHDSLLLLAGALWKRPVHECRALAAFLLERFATRLEPADLVATLEPMLRQSKTWALVDQLSTDVICVVVAAHPAKVSATLDRWSKDEDFWIRRASMLVLLRPLRAGAGDWKRFTRYADAMLDESEFFIRKAIGWILRDASRRSPERVYRWLAPRAARASGVTMREAVKYLTPAQRRTLLARRAEAKR